MDVIIQMGFPGYFLVVADFIMWAKNNGIAVGPGRGSAAGNRGQQGGAQRGLIKTTRH